MADVIAATPFFRKTYDEALSLVIEARNYLAFAHPRECDVLDPDTRLLISQETMRITSRLTQAMAWMLAHRAVETGEMMLEEALSERFALSAHAVCLDERWLRDDRLPEAVLSLGRRSLDLFIRIDRLEAMLRSQQETADAERADRGAPVDGERADGEQAPPPSPPEDPQSPHQR